MNYFVSFRTFVTHSNNSLILEFLEIFSMSLLCIHKKYKKKQINVLGSPKTYFYW